MNLRSMGICAVLCAPLLSQAQGMAPTLHPETFCPLGAKMGMATGPFDKVDFPGCSSPPKAVTANRGRSGLQNTLAFRPRPGPALWHHLREFGQRFAGSYVRQALSMAPLGQRQSVRALHVLAFAIPLRGP